MSVFVKIEILLSWCLYLWKLNYNWAGFVCICKIEIQLSWWLYLWKLNYNWAGFVCISENRNTTELVSVFVKIELQLSWFRLYLWKLKYNWAGVCICENRNTTELVSSVFVKIKIQLSWWLYLWKLKYDWAGVVCIWRFSWSSCSLPPKKLPSSTPSWKYEQMTKRKTLLKGL